MYALHLIRGFSSTGSNIDSFLSFYRKNFSTARVTPKLHMMEDHVVPWIRKWRLGMRFHSEQGAESIHAIFNSLKRTYSGVRNSVERFRYMLKEHCLQNAPLNITAEPAVRKRKKEDGETQEITS